MRGFLTSRVLSFASIRRQMSTQCPDGYHIEKDSLGSVNVCMNSKWKAQTQRAIENFPISGYRMPKAMIESLALIKYCSAKANAMKGVLDEAKANCIAEVSIQIYKGDRIDDGSFPLDIFQTGSGTSTNMNMNEVISTLAYEQFGFSLHPNDDINKSQSSNDVIPTAMNIAVIRDTHRLLLPALCKLIESIQRKIEVQYPESHSMIKTGRTHLMDALPLSIHQEWTTWKIQLQYAQQQIAHHLVACYQLPIGGTAIGTGFNTPSADYAQTVVDILNETLSLPPIPQQQLEQPEQLEQSKHPQQQQQQSVKFQSLSHKFSYLAHQDHLIAFSGGSLRTLTGILLKIASDLRLMNSGPSSGLHEVSLPRVQPGSSIMPGKVNPVICESAILVCLHCLGSDSTIAQTTNGSVANFQLSTAMPLLAFHLLENIRLLANTCSNLAEKAIDGLVFEREVLQENVEKNPMAKVTALSPLIGYEVAAKIMQEEEEYHRGGDDGVGCSGGDAGGTSLEERVVAKTGLTLEQVQAAFQDVEKQAYPFGRGQDETGEKGGGAKGEELGGGTELPLPVDDAVFTVEPTS